MVQLSRTHLRRTTVWVLFTSTTCLATIGSSEAQVTTDITATTSSLTLRTAVSSPNGNTTVITGGTQAGPNLFHSFKTFSVGTGALAQFKNAGAHPICPPSPIANIFARVIGGQASHIDGTIQTVGFGQANLWFMNPSGIIFGANAKLDITGSATFTTANLLKLSRGGKFSADPAIAQDKLTVGSVASFGFLQTTPPTQPSPITVDGSNLSVSSGQTLALVGGDIHIKGKGTLQAPNGAVRVTSSRSQGSTVTRDTSTGTHSLSSGTLATITLSPSVPPHGRHTVIDTSSSGQIQLNGVIYNGTNGNADLNPTTPNNIVIKQGLILEGNLPPTKLTVSSSNLTATQSDPPPQPDNCPNGACGPREDPRPPSTKQLSTKLLTNPQLQGRCTGSVTDGEFSSFAYIGRDAARPRPGGLVFSPPYLDAEIPLASGRSGQPTVRAAAPLSLAPGTIAFLPRSGGC